MKKIYLVGGAVRDKLMNKRVSDKDYVAVGYEPKDFAHLPKVGKDFPVFLLENGSELALARSEKKIAKGYAGFSFNTKNISLEDDLKRRDLTINSIAYDEEQKKIIDPFGGENDIKHKILRHTSSAFVQDPLRVLRLARFRASFGRKWQIHKSTQDLVKLMKEELKFLEPNRTYKEIQKVLDLSQSELFFETLEELGVLEFVFPNIFELTKLRENSVFHLENSVFVHTMMVLKKLKNSSHLLKLTALYHDIAKPLCYRLYGSSAGHENPKLVEELLDIEIPKKIKKKMLFLIANHIKIGRLTKMRSKKIALFLESFRKDKSLFLDLIKFCQADNNGRKTNQKKEPNFPSQDLIEVFDKIASYSPRSWIKMQKKPPSPETIKQHIHKRNIEFVESFLRNF